MMASVYVTAIRAANASARRALAAMGHGIRADAEDVAQEALARWLEAGSEDTRHLRRLAWDAAVDMVRARGREMAALHQHPSILHRRDSRELDQGLAAALAALLAATRRRGGQRTARAVTRELRIIELAMNGRTNAQIAMALDMTPEQVRTYRQRIRRRLRRVLEAL